LPDITDKCKELTTKVSTMKENLSKCLSNDITNNNSIKDVSRVIRNKRGLTNEIKKI